MNIPPPSETDSPARPTSDAHDTTNVAAKMQEAVRQSILAVAPDLSATDLDIGTDVRDDLGLDSIDLVNIAKAIGDRTGVEIPDRDYARLHRIGEIVDFVVEQSSRKS